MYFWKRGTRTGRPQPTQSKTTVPFLFTPLLGVPVAAGVSASLGGVLGLEPGNVLCDAPAAAALKGTGGCTKGVAGRSVVSAGLHKRHGKRDVTLSATTSECQRSEEDKREGEIRTVCNRHHTFSYSAPLPGAIALRHRPRCRLALQQTVLTPVHHKIPFSLSHSIGKSYTSVLRASSRSALAMLLADTNGAHILGSRNGDIGHVQATSLKKINYYRSKVVYQECELGGEHKRADACSDQGIQI
jgi:hypothetical protein